MKAKHILTAAVCGILSTAAYAQEAKKPNILIIWGDDIGWFNTSCYNSGMMGYQTPNIDRIAKEGARFTDWYGQQSCTAGRAAFITGQSPIRTGLLKIGMPGDTAGINEKDPTLATLLKPHGYMTAQMGKNHLGDRDEHLPTNHGFDEFFGNLYHLNAEQEPEHPDYPKGDEFKKKFGPRGVIHSTADGKIEDTGPLTKKRMETIDEEVTAKSLDFIERAHKADKPFFLWYNTTRMHIFTHLKEASQGVTGQGIYADGMVEHDGMVGQMLDKLDELGIADNTIIMYSTDNGAEFMSWPDGGTTPFKGEKNTQWEGGYRVPCLIKWPGVIKEGSVINGVAAHEDMIPTLMAAVGDTTVVEDLKKGKSIDGKDYKVHLDGSNLMPYFKDQSVEWPRKSFIYWTDGGSVAALRYNDWKATFLRQDHEGLSVWIEPFTELRAPMLHNLRMDPFERAHEEGMDYNRWFIEHMFMIMPAGGYIGNWMQSFKEFPPRMKPGSFSLDRVMESITSGAKGASN
ncbi:arylsulfatase [Haloferula chungangensis]|uniref:Arylsulfatase n=1 Tax=Haloferula chungangensis TaxID=1048331 RepID=A0ABW2LBR3_9BACT